MGKTSLFFRMPERWQIGKKYLVSCGHASEGDTKAPFRDPLVACFWKSSAPYFATWQTENVLHTGKEAVMARQVLTEAVVLHGNEQPDNAAINCSVGIMAYNEEANIRRTVEAILHQQAPSVSIQEVIVVASGCTDKTVPILADIARKEPRVRVCIQEKREGKASAINVFLKQAISPVVMLIGADVIPESTAIEYLCTPFADPNIGMVGGHPIPVNDSATFMGHAVHLLWRLHDALARIRPKLGEVISFRNVITGIPTDSAVDEISIQALISQLGYKLVYRPECVVYNKGPLTVRDFLKQRRRIYAGHLKVLRQQKYEASTMKVSPIFRQLLSARHYALSTPRQIMWTFGTMALEGYARLQGHYDYRRKREHHIWQPIATT